MKLILTNLIVLFLFTSCLEQQAKVQDTSEDVSSLRDSASGQSCVKKKPSLFFYPNGEFSGVVGGSISFDVKLKNNSQNCGKTTFDLNYMNAPAGIINNLPEY